MTQKTGWGSRLRNCGCVVLALLPVVGLVLLIIYKPIPGADLVAWWRRAFGDPVLELVVAALLATGGNVIAALGLVAVGHWVVNRLAYLLPNTLLGAAAQTFEFMGVGRVSGENLHASLRRVFADDVEKVAFYQSRLYGAIPERQRRHPLFAGCGGCLLATVTGTGSTLVTFFIGLAVLDSLLRLFGQQDTPEQLLSSIGGLGPELAPLLPLPRAVHGIELSERSLLLVVVVGLLVWLNWFVRNVSAAGWTRPRPPGRLYWILPLPGLVLAWIFLDGLLLIYALLFQAAYLLDFVVSRIGRGLYLRARGVSLRWRAAARTGLSTEPTAPASNLNGVEVP